MKTILVVEDDNLLSSVLSEILKVHHCVVSASNVLDAKKILTESQVHLVLLDLNLPDGSGYELCSFIKNNGPTQRVPVLILSGNAEVSAKVASFELGADDYIQKPFSKEELLARIKAKFRSTSEQSHSLLQIGNYVIDRSRLKISFSNGDMRALELSPMEFRILSHLMENEGQVFSRDQLISVCVGPDYIVTDRTIDTHISSIRKALDDETSAITTHYGTGYSFNLKKR